MDYGVGCTQPQYHYCVRYQKQNHGLPASPVEQVAIFDCWSHHADRVAQRRPWLPWSVNTMNLHLH